MNQEQIKAAKETEEMWVTTGSGTIYVNVTNMEGRTVGSGVGGRPEAMLRITTYDRLRNQESCQDPSNDPFTNGMLWRQDSDQQGDPTTASPNAMTAEQAAEIFGLSKSDFRSKVNELGEYSVRRLLEMVDEVDATSSQVDALKEMLSTKWPNTKGAMPIYAELKSLGQVATADR